MWCKQNYWTFVEEFALLSWIVKGPCSVARPRQTVAPGSHESSERCRWSESFLNLATENCCASICEWKPIGGLANMHSKVGLQVQGQQQCKGLLFAKARRRWLFLTTCTSLHNFMMKILKSTYVLCEFALRQLFILFYPKSSKIHP